MIRAHCEESPEVIEGGASRCGSPQPSRSSAIREGDVCWSVITETDFEWTGLQQRLRESYDELRKSIAAHAPASVESIGGAVGAVAHAAYHLGAIRQKAALSRKG
jgi:hypothetical protein